MLDPERWKQAFFDYSTSSFAEILHRAAPHLLPGPSEPTREELEAFVRRHSGWPISRLRAATGLAEEDIRALLQGAAEPGGADR